ncbi:MAG: Hsp20 family protein [Alphaproteobacteria bacterium]|nr:Hsp20 family protein [Alphaproteobacteria bacterium]
MTNLVSFSPLMRHTVGFDRFNDLFESLMNTGEERFDNYPPYNIEKTAEDRYRITLAVAGFGDNDIDITVQDDTLKISGRIEQKTEDSGTHYLHRGIAARAFERSFRLADHIQVEEAGLKDGLLTVSLKREVPEEKKPRMIPVNGKSKGLLGSKK